MYNERDLEFDSKTNHRGINRRILKSSRIKNRE